MLLIDIVVEEQTFSENRVRVLSYSIGIINSFSSWDETMPFYGLKVFFANSQVCNREGKNKQRWVHSLLYSLNLNFLYLSFTDGFNIHNNKILQVYRSKHTKLCVFVGNCKRVCRRNLWRWRSLQCLLLVLSPQVAVKGRIQNELLVEDWILLMLKTLKWWRYSFSFYRFALNYLD